MTDLTRIGWPLLTDRTELRPLVPADTTGVQAYRGLDEVCTYLPHPPLTTAETGERVATWCSDADRLAIAVRSRGRPEMLGDVQLMLRRSPALAPAVTEEWEASLGYAFHPRAQGQGMATEAVRAVIEVAFGTLGLRRVSARVFSGAVASSRLLARLGLRHEGTERAAALGRDGAWLDDELWAAHAATWGADPRLGGFGRARGSR